MCNYLKYAADEFGKRFNFTDSSAASLSGLPRFQFKL